MFCFFSFEGFGFAFMCMCVFIGCFEFGFEVRFCLVEDTTAVRRMRHTYLRRIVMPLEVHCVVGF